MPGYRTTTGWCGGLDENWCGGLASDYLGEVYGSFILDSATDGTLNTFHNLLT